MIHCNNAEAVKQLFSVPVNTVCYRYTSHTGGKKAAYFGVTKKPGLWYCIMLVFYFSRNYFVVMWTTAPTVCSYRTIALLFWFLELSQQLTAQIQQ